ncbi:class I SAM-dependent methyltransferase [Pelatocladus sp. BLCC-F211]|uniref:class I SAM-dependent methyltransferase n=1 Tax=Pelatocladus sp. BLCC-F211 TaxID=3342752 RepID=UPI0035B73239
MAEESDQTVVGALLDHILPLVPGLVEALQAGIDVLDIGCGSGQAMSMLAQTFPQSRFTGYDFSSEAIATARTEAHSKCYRKQALQILK